MIGTPDMKELKSTKELLIVMIYLGHSNPQILDIHDEETRQIINSSYLKNTMEKLWNIEYSNLTRSDVHSIHGIYCVNWFVNQKIVSILSK